MSAQNGVEREDIEQAAQRLEGRVRTTPILKLEEGAFGVSGALTLKLEQLQHTGTFKARGAFNRLLSASISSAGVVAASGGNHGVAVAYAARELGYKAEIFVPEISAPVKIARLREYGAQVTIIGRNYAEALEASTERAAQTGAVVVHAYDQPEIVAGQGTVGREFEAQAPDLDTVLVSVGGGGLIGGISAWYRGSARVIGVEPKQAPTLTEALGAGEPVNVEVSRIAADSLGARRTGDIAFSIARRFVEGTVLVEDGAISSAQRALWDSTRLIAEPGGATALAALLSGAYRPESRERVGVLICGGNTDPSLVA